MTNIELEIIRTTLWNARDIIDLAFADRNAVREKSILLNKYEMNTEQRIAAFCVDLTNITMLISEELVERQKNE